MTRLFFVSAVSALLTVTGCGAPAPDEVDQGTLCVTDVDCTDGVFCNGVERCRPTAADADIRGCAPSATPRCLAVQTCDETSDECITSCADDPDADGDGRDAISCGGDDCDDANANRFPGNPEVCDDLDVDEDCSPSTFGALDSDQDGFVSAACCNVDSTDQLFCGDDCDDSEPTVHPTEAEACDGLDNDCDGEVDEGGRVFYRDADGDGFGDPAGDTREACRKPDGYAEDNTDCDDSVGGRNPGAPEVCDAIPDNDCDDSTHPFDDDLDGYDRTACGGSDCNDGDSLVYPGAPEACDGVDNDCSSGGGAAMDEDADGDSHAPLDATCVGGFPADDCDDGESRAFPGAAEVCDGVDNDCDNVEDENPEADTSCMQPGTVATCGVDECVISECIAPRLNCNGITADGCEADITSDELHCGECGFPCAEGADCIDRVCVCPAGTLDCIAACVDDMNDPLNCGDCGIECPTGGQCEMGSCVCPSGESLCDGGCFDTTTSPVHCGGCDNECGAGNACVASGCVVSPIIELTSGGNTACIIRENDNVACWGFDTEAMGERRAEPTLVEPADGIVEISSMGEGACARLVGGQVWCWGHRAYPLGRVFSDEDPDFLPPGPVAALEDAVNMDASRTAGMIPNANSMGCAVRSTGSVVCWGTGSLGRTGVNVAVTPVSVVGLSNALAVSVGGNLTCALRGDGRVACWGDNGKGQLGNPTAGSLEETPVLVTGLSDAVEISVGAEAACARRVGGGVACWGDGFGTSATAVAGLADIVQIDMGPGHLCAVGSDDSLRCLGANGTGQLGDGSATPTSTPFVVPGTFAQVRAYGSHDSATSGSTCARRTSGGVACWGNGGGLLGNGTFDGSPVPVEVIGL